VRGVKFARTDGANVLSPQVIMYWTRGDIFRHTHTCMQFCASSHLQATRSIFGYLAPPYMEQLLLKPPLITPSYALIAQTSVYRVAGAEAPVGQVWGVAPFLYGDQAGPIQTCLHVWE
jgi:hypothetical protein